MLNSKNNRVDRVLQQRFEKSQSEDRSARAARRLVSVSGRMWGKSNIILFDDADEYETVEERERRIARVEAERAVRLEFQRQEAAKRAALLEEQRKAAEIEHQKRRAERIRKKAEEKEVKKFAVVSKNWQSAIAEEAW